MQTKPYAIHSITASVNSIRKWYNGLIWANISVCLGYFELFFACISRNIKLTLFFASITCYYSHGNSCESKYLEILHRTAERIVKHWDDNVSNKVQCYSTKVRSDLNKTSSNMYSGVFIEQSSSLQFSFRNPSERLNAFDIEGPIYATLNKHCYANRVDWAMFDICSMLNIKRKPTPFAWIL